MKKGTLSLFIFFILLCVATYSSAQKNKSTSSFKLRAQASQTDYLPQTIIFKIKSSLRSHCGNTFINIPEFNQFLKEIGAPGIAKKFPFVKPPEQEFDKYGRRLADLSLIYEVHYSKSISLEKTINKLYALGIVQYAQPHYIPRFCYSANDTYYSSQYNVTQIKADSAWDINKGDTNVVIGIVDTGTDPLHPDLIDNIKYNYGDPINGLDDDHDGYIDNHYGWDLANNSNNTTWQGDPHGVHVCGIASASTDNNMGIAGIGFHCKFLPVKAANKFGVLVAAYEGIQYAADHGCAIINCSWGGTEGGPYGQDIVNYATINKNALVVAAAGNDGLKEMFFPACYQYVLNVASVGNTDVLSGFSDYGYNVSVCAPGENILSTYDSPGPTYATLSGTSMAAPCGAGAAAIVKSYFPSYNASQLAQRLITTADNIDSKNPSRVNMLGGGRINLYRALTSPSTPSVVMTYDSIIDNNDNIFVTGDTLRIRDIFTNYLAPTTNLMVTLSSTSPYVSIINNSITLGAVATMGTANNFSTPFTAKIIGSAPINTTVDFELTYTDGTYVAHQFFSVLINVDYLNIAINDIATTITSKGLIGYDGPNQTGGGLGFTYNGSQTLLTEGGLMIGYDSNHVSDYVRNTITNDADFQSMVNVHEIYPPKVSEYDLDGYFNDAIAPNPLPVKVHHQAFAWSTPGNQKYVIVQYTIYNTGLSAENNLYAGIFADWDITAATYNQNRSLFDAAYRMNYSWYTGSSQPYCGMALLSSSAPVISYSIDNDSSGDGGVNIYNGMSAGQKYFVMSHNRDSAGFKKSSGDDIVSVLSTGPFHLNPGDSTKIAFALLAGDSLQDLEASADSASHKLTGAYLSVPALINNRISFQNYPNPATDYTNIVLHLQQKETVCLNLYNSLGEKVMTIFNNALSAGEHIYSINTSSLTSGIYYYRLSCQSGTFVKKLMIVK